MSDPDVPSPPHSSPPHSSPLPSSPLPGADLAAPPPARYQRDEDYFAWIGLALAIASWLTCCCSIVPFVGIVFNLLGLLVSVVAIVFGALSIRNARRAGEPMGLGIAVVVLGGARLLLVVAAVAVLLLALALGIGGGLVSAVTQGVSP